MNAIDAIVGAHDGPGIGLLQRDAERLQVNLVQRSFRHLRADRKPLKFLIVADKMLDTGGHPPALQAIDVGRGHRAAEVGVFGKAFKVAPGDGRARDVHRGGQQHVCPAAASFLGQGRAHLGDQVGIPGGAQGHAHREADGRVPQIVVGSAHAVGAVAHARGGDARFGQGNGVPHVGSGEEGGFLRQGELCQQAIEVLCYGWVHGGLS